MQVDKLSRLIGAFSQANQNSSAKNISEDAAKAAPTDSSEAVNLSPGLSADETKESADSRTDRVADLKKQVEQGTYRPDRNAVAAAVADALFA